MVYYMVKNKQDTGLWACSCSKEVDVNQVTDAVCPV